MSFGDVFAQFVSASGPERAAGDGAGDGRHLEVDLLVPLSVFSRRKCLACGRVITIE